MLAWAIKIEKAQIHTLRTQVNEVYKTPVTESSIVIL